MLFPMIGGSLTVSQRTSLLSRATPPLLFLTETIRNTSRTRKSVSVPKEQNPVDSGTSQSAGKDFTCPAPVNLGDSIFPKTGDLALCLKPVEHPMPHARSCKDHHQSSPMGCFPDHSIMFCSISLPISWRRPEALHTSFIIFRQDGIGRFCGRTE